MDPYDSYSNSELNLKFIEYKLSVIHTNISVLKKYVINVWKKKVATASNAVANFAESRQVDEQPFLEE